MHKKLYRTALLLCLSTISFSGNASRLSEILGGENKEQSTAVIAQQSLATRASSPSMKKENGTEKAENEAVVKLTWEMLEDIKYVERKHKKYGSIYFPTVGDNLRQLAGKQVQISGFVIPISMEEYAISKNLMANCFFCGGDGPESIAEISFKNRAPRLKTDQHISIQGKFRFNETDPDNWIYFIEEAVVVKR